jgi:transmembrane sensor
MYKRVKEELNIELEMIVRYLSESASESEMEAVINWIAEKEENKRLFSEIKMIWLESGVAYQKDDDELDNTYNRLIARIRSQQSDNFGLSLKKNSRKFGLNFYKVAAAIFALVSLSVSILYITKIEKEVPAVLYSEIVIPYGSKSSLILSDGTKIWLNSGSKLRYPDRFTGDKRDVFLEGEAFFEVTPNKKSLFVVKTAQVNVKVYGTKFNVKCFPGEKNIETALVSGSIELEKIGNNGKVIKTFKMKPRQIVAYSKANDQFVLFDSTSFNKSKGSKQSPNFRHMEPIQPKSIDIVTSWKDNKLTFRSDSINVLTEKLQRWYNVTIELKAEELKNFTFTGTFTTETVEQALKYLQLTTPFDYEIHKNKIVINSITKSKV